jgi:hypothetical protein
MTVPIIRRANRRASALRTASVAAAIALGVSACDGLLKVSNPVSVEEGQLENPALQDFLINGVIGEFQFAYTNYAFFSGVLADEVFTDHPNVNFREFSLHRFTDLNTTNELVYAALQQARQSADDAADRLKRLLGPDAESSLNVARALIYGGYAYVLLGEGFCEAPVNLSAPLSPSELLSRAVARFDEGIAVATAAAEGTDLAAAQDLVSLAHVGAARASLRNNDPTRARAHAVLVPDSYERWAYYSANSVRENNAVQLAVRFNQPWLGMQRPFRDLRDARVPQPAVARRSLVGNPIFPPLTPSMYSGWTATGPAPAIDPATHVRFASGLEARYIVIEADGPTAEMLAFVNARRVVGGTPPVNLTGPALVEEFQRQRALDFYLTGQRLGDLRRYAAVGTDLFPTGKFPTSPDSYGTMHCLIVPLSEKARNPNY